MRKVRSSLALIALASLAATAPSHAANAACDGKRNQRDYDQCYAYSVNGALLRSNKNLERIYASGKVPQKEKESIQKHRAVWGTAVDKKCRDNVCVYDGLTQLNEDLEAVMKKYGLQPY